MEIREITKWEALLAVTEKDHDDIVQGKRDLCHLIPSSSPKQDQNQEEKKGFEEKMSITAKDFSDIVQGKRKLCDPIPSSSLKQDQNQEEKKGIVENMVEMPNACISIKRKRTQGIKNTPSMPIAAKKLKKGKEAVYPLSLVDNHEKNGSRMKNHSKPPRPLMKSKSVQDEGPSIMPEKMSEAIKKMGGIDIKWVSKKDVCMSDIRTGQNRLYIPRQIEQVLTESEKSYLKMGLESEIEVLIVDVLGTDQYNFPRLTFKYWGSISRYIFIRQWNTFVGRHGLQANIHQLDIWSFRRPGHDDQQGKLCFAINVRRKNDKQNNLQASSSKNWDNEASTSGGDGSFAD